MSSRQSGARDRILDVAERLHDEVGPGFTMEQLEAGSAVSRASIYRQVGSKSDVLRQLAERGIAVDERRDTRTRILDAARQVFGTRGLQAATIEQIAAKAGVGVATVYRHFGDKERLALAFMQEMTPRSLIQDAVLHPTPDVTGDVERIAEVMARAFSEHRELLRLVFLGGEDERRYLEQLREPADSTFGRLVEYFRAQLDAGRLRTVAQPDELALALLGMVVAFTVIGPLHYRRADDDPPHVAGVIAELLLTDVRGGRP